MKKTILMILISLLLIVSVSGTKYVYDNTNYNKYNITNITLVEADNFSGTFSGNATYAITSNYSSYSNTSTYWDSETSQADLNVNHSNTTSFIEWSGILNKFITAVGDIYIYMSGTTLTLNETQLNATIDSIVVSANSSMKTYVDTQDVIFNDSMKTYTDNTFITQATEGDLNVNNSNSTDFMTWTGLHTYPAACPVDTYVTQIDDSVTCTGISDVYVLTSGDEMTGNLTLTGGAYVNAKFNWTTTDEWSSFDGSTFDFNESMLSTTYYDAISMNIVAGTLDGGSLSNTTHSDGSYDGITMNISEASGSPGLDVRINFTDGETFNLLIMRYKTSELSGDYPILQLWNYDTLEWEDYPIIGTTTDFKIIDRTVFDPSSHISGGIVQLRFYKSSNGNTNNHYYIDWLAIATGYGTPIGYEIDPLSFHKDMNLDNTGYNITTDFFNGDGSLLTGITSGWNLTGSNYLYNITDILHLNETKLNKTIETIGNATYIIKTGDSTGDLTSDLNIDSNTLVVDYNDNEIGIGTATPTHKLEVVGNSSFSDDMYIPNDKKIYFGDSEDGYIYWNSTDGELVIKVN